MACRFPISRITTRRVGCEVWTAGLCLTGDLASHLNELPQLRTGLEELEEPLDLWLYFLQNGESPDADALPSPLDVREIRRAMAVLKILAQNDLERELNKGRLKAKRDLQIVETLRDQWQRRYLETKHHSDVVSRKREEARRNAEKRGLADFARLSKRPLDDVEDLAGCSLDELRNLGDRLERDLTG